MAQSPNLDHGYYAKIQTEGLAWSLRVNDLFIRENGDPGYVTSDGNIGLKLQPGTNQITLQFSPVTGQKSADGDFLFELRDGLMIEVIIQRLDFATRESLEIAPIKLRYNGERGEFVTEDKTAAGFDRVLALPNIRSDGRYTIADLPPGAMVFRTGERLGGYRLDFDIELDDEKLPPFHWRKDAVPMTDTPETRAGLMQAYRRLHDQIARGDSAAILNEARPVWERTAYILTSDTTTAEAFINKTELGLGLFQKSHPDGSELQQLRMKAPLETASLQFMDDGRLVRIRPDPIVWALPPGDGSDITSVFPVVFYQTASGEWHFADINVGL